jgi:hypothetical protein
MVQNEECAVIVATRNGRPLVAEEDEFVFSVSPLFIHPGDVDLKSGNLRFKGDLKILGNVVEGMIVESRGSMEVVGTVAGSHLFCGGSAVFLNHLINSDINIGIYKDIYLKLSSFLEELDQMFVDLQEHTEQIEQTLSDRMDEAREGLYREDEGRLILLLFERQCDNLPELCGELLKILSNAKFSLPSTFENDLREICDYILNTVCQDKAELKELINVHRKIKDAGVFAQKEGKIVSDLSVSYVQHCHVRNGGNIKISGIGSYNSHFYTPMNMYVEGVFRGGSINAGGDVFISEAGSPALPLKQCEILLKQDSAASFEIIYENVTIFFGEHVYKFSQTREMVKVLYDQELGGVIVTSLTKEAK